MGQAHLNRESRAKAACDSPRPRAGLSPGQQEQLAGAGTGAQGRGGSLQEQTFSSLARIQKLLGRVSVSPQAHTVRASLSAKALLLHGAGTGPGPVPSAPSHPPGVSAEVTQIVISAPSSARMENTFHNTHQQRGLGRLRAVFIMCFELKSSECKVCYC